MFDVANEFEFWGRQIVEHALFAHLTLEEPALKAQALEMHNALRQAYDARDLRGFTMLTQQFMAFKQAALAQQRAGQWIGWAFPSFIQHMLEEEAFFLSRVANAPSTPQQVLAFWLKERMGEAEVGAHLIDPSEIAAVAKMAETAHTFATLGRLALGQCNAERVIVASQAAGALANEAVLAMQPGRPASLISPELKDHIAREGDRFVQTTRQLLGGQ